MATTAPAKPAHRQAPVKTGAAPSRARGHAALRALAVAHSFGPVQAKLTVGPAHDAYEREADHVAERVMSMPAAPAGRSPPHDGPPPLVGHRVQRLCKACEEDLQRQPLEEGEEELVQAKTATAQSPQPLDSAIGSRIQSIKGGGRPLPASERAFFEPRFGRDFGNVRVHADAAAADAARAVGARAFTLGHDVVFAAGQYAPGTLAGRSLLAHELTHVAQQNAASVSTSTIQRRCTAAEIGPTPEDCRLVSAPLGERRYLFDVDCDDFARGEQLRLQKDLALIPPGTTVSILGAASSDGDHDFNAALSCARASAAEAVVRGMPNPPTITPVEAVGPQGPPGDATFRAVSIDFTFPTVTPPSAPPSNPGFVESPPRFPNPLDPRLIVIPTDPVGAFAVCQTIPPLTGAVCGANVTGLPCPEPYCVPFPTIDVALACRNRAALVLLAGITAAVGDTRVTPYFRAYLHGGTRSQIDMSGVFGTDFAAHAASIAAANYLAATLQTYLNTAASTLFVGTGPWTINFTSVLTSQITDLENTSHAQHMNFAPASTIPGVIAGGVGLGQSACSAGFVPSAFNDHRRATVSATVMSTAGGGFLITPQIDFRVEDTIDFCPGNCGAASAWPATFLLSRLEASGVSGDVPFLVDYTVHPPPFFV